MQWLRRVLGGRDEVQPDPDRQEALLRDVRHRFGSGLGVPAADQVDAVVRLLDGVDGVPVAARVVAEFAEAAHADLLAQAHAVYQHTGHRLLVDRRNYRPLWRAAGARLRWQLFELPCGFHPYVQVAGAATVLGAQASRWVRATDPYPPLAQVFEVFDLTAIGWEFGGVRMDTDTLALANRLITAAAQIRAAMADPPPLPLSVRELMRRNNSIDVYPPAGAQVVTRFNPGAELRATLLV